MPANDDHSAVAEPFHLLRPQDLPRIPSGGSTGAAGAAAVVENVLRGVDHDTLDTVEAALWENGLTAADFTVLTDDPSESVSNRANDQAFGIVRVSGDRLGILRHSTLRGYQTLLRDQFSSGTDLSATKLDWLHLAFVRLLALHSGTVDPTAVKIAVELPRPGLCPPPDGTYAQRRWIAGHHVFMVLVQGLIIALQEMAEDVRIGRIAGAQRWFDLASALMRGSDAALTFTGNFPYSEYEKRVRPTLIPPTAPPDMSGLRWRDHEYLIRVLVRLRPIFADLDPRLEPWREEFVQALSGSYDAHKTVCAHFVGNEQSSVLMSTRTTQPAVSTLDKFKRSRSALLRSGRRPGRSDPADPGEQGQ